MTYEVIKKEYVVETLGKGSTVILCDFDTMRMMNCVDMSVRSINSYIDKANTVFYKGVKNE